MPEGILAWFTNRTNTYHTCLECYPIPFVPFPNDTIIIAVEKSLWDSYPHLKLCYRCRHRQNPETHGDCARTVDYDFMEREIRAKYPNTPFRIQRI